LGVHLLGKLKMALASREVKGFHQEFVVNARFVGNSEIEPSAGAKLLNLRLLVIR
jgi:hypothetical protein